MPIRFFVIPLCAAFSLVAGPKQIQWVATWAAAASPQMPTQAERTKAHLVLENQTVREIVHLSIGGSTIRLRLSTQFGTEPVEVGGVHVASCGQDGQITVGSDHAVTFSGKTSFTIPASAPFLSDPIDMKVAAASNLCLNILIPKKADAAGIHYDAKQQNYLLSGDATAAEGLSSPVTINSWLFLAGVDVTAAASSGAIVAFGDSITDGAASTPGANRR